MIDNHLDETIKTYDLLGENYSPSTAGLVDKEDFDKLVKLIPANAKVLDAGCGYGKELKLFVDAGYNVTGIDLSAGMLEQSKKNVPGAKLAQMDVRKLNFPKDAFDAVWCHTVLLHLPPTEAKKAIKEFYRVLKNGGILFASAKKAENSQGMTKEDIKGLPRWFQYYTKEEFLDLFQSTGFNIIETMIFNERERYGADKRDLMFIEVLAKKNERS